MRNVFLYLIMICSVTILSQNSIQVSMSGSVIPANGTVFVTTAANTTVSTSFDITNTSGSTFSYTVKRFDKHMFTDTFSFASAKFSFMGNNYPVGTFTAGPLILGPGQNAGPANLLIATLDETNNNPGKTEIRYTFLNTGVPNDTFQFVLKYNYANLDWQAKPTFSGAQRQNAVAFTIANKAYIGTGNDGANKNDFWNFDPISNTWTQMASFPGTARENAVGFAIGTDGFIGTGNDGGLKNDFWKYNSTTNTWTQVANFAGTARENAVGFAIGTDGYIGTGNDGSLKNDFWKYNSITNTWLQVASFPGTPRENAVSFVVVSTGFIGTGNDGGLKNDFWQYHPLVNTWIQKASFAGSARQGAAGVGNVIGNIAFVGTGNDGSNRNDIWEYDISANLWDKKLDYAGTARSSSASFLIGNSAFFGTGNDGSSKNDFWECRPSPTTIGIHEYQDKANKVKVEAFPNPSSGIFKVKVDSRESIKLEVYDINGKKLNYSYTFNNERNIDLSKENKGSYMIKFQIGEQEITKWIFVN